MTAKQRNNCILYGASVLLLLVLDQFTKYFASTYLANGHSIVLIEGVFQLHYLENQGAAFGMLQGKKLWFVAITLIMLLLMVLVYFRTPFEKRYRWFRIILTL